MENTAMYYALTAIIIIIWYDKRNNWNSKKNNYGYGTRK